MVAGAAMETLLDDPAEKGGAARKAKIAGAIAFLVLAALVFLPLDIGWTALQKNVRRQFPDVTWIQPPALEDWLNDPRRAAPVLLDVRTPAEFAVSHLPGARRVDPGGPVSPGLDGRPRDTPIVTYCAVGYRSANYAGRLQRAGYRSVAVDRKSVV